MYGIPNKCACCACDPSVHLSVPSIVFFVCRKLSPRLEFGSWITGVCSTYVVSLYDFVYYVVGKEPANAMHLAFWYVVLVCHQSV